MFAKVSSHSVCTGSPSTRRARAFSSTVVLAMSLGLVLASLSQADVGTSWKVIRRDEGIVTSMREREGAELPAFRSQTSLQASVWEILAVLEDVSRACEWTSHCRSMRQVKRFTELDRVVYARIAAPWPVRDRDVVTRVQARYASPQELHLSIRGQGSEHVGERDGVIRMPRFTALYRFRPEGEHTTRVLYEVDVDPGGSLPDWLKRHIAREFPHDTLASLRDRLRWAGARPEYRSRAAVLASTAKADGFLAQTQGALMEGPIAEN